MTTQPHIRALPLFLAIEGGEQDIPTSYDAFVRDNGLSDDEAEELAVTLLEHGEFHGGGGARPGFTLFVQQTTSHQYRS